jgi:Zn-finger protein
MMFGRKLVFANRDDAVAPVHDTAYSEVHTKSELCASCHNVTHPFNKLAIERTYDEWRDSLYNSQGIECQDCHMPKVKGRSSNISKEREDIASHTFAGANTTLLNHFNKDTTSNYALFKTAAKMEFVDLQTLRLGMNAITIRVHNVGAGHKLPTGFPEGREMWVYFLVQDSTNRTIYESGKVEHGHTKEGTKSFKAVLGDKNGDVVDVNVWEADRILSDTRILPKSYTDVTYMFEIIGNATPPFRIQAKLNYWPFPQHIVDELLGKNKMKVDIVEMATLSN